MTCLLVGAGYMSSEYIKVLKNFPIKLKVIGRGENNISILKKQYELDAFSGGLENYLIQNSSYIPDFGIIAVSINDLYSNTILLIKHGVKNILIEKPLVLNWDELLALEQLAIFYKTSIYIAYNRRFYCSVENLKELIKQDGGVSSIHFEFTEWIDVINKVGFTKEVLNKFFIANSTHVVDTVFHLIGKPENINTYVSGSSVDWHKSGSIFMGFGESEKKIPFSYTSNWGSPGRWAIEVLTKKNRFYLKPMEQLFVQVHGSVLINEIEIDRKKDIDFKPGIYHMVHTFLYNSNKSDLCNISDLKSFFPFYEKIAGY